MPWCDGAAKHQAVRAAPSVPRWRQTVRIRQNAIARPLLDVEGWVRDAPLALNRLVHVRGVGAARIVHCEVYSTSEAATPSAAKVYVTSP